MEWLDLKDKVVVVTGGASGIGKSICKEFYRQKSTVIIIDKQVGENVKTEYGYCMHCDITNHQEVVDTMQTIMKNYGKIDVLINNAGISIPGLLVDESPKYELNESTFNKTIDVNVKGLFFCSQEAVRFMKNVKKGVIINMSSECGKEGSFAQSIYSASKAAVDSFTRSWAKELGKYGIRVVAIAPGPMEVTSLFSDNYMDVMCHCRKISRKEFTDNYAKTTLLGREGHLEEVANLAVFLASDRASFITGTTINISGGKSRG